MDIPITALFTMRVHIIASHVQGVVLIYEMNSELVISYIPTQDVC